MTNQNMNSDNVPNNATDGFMTDVIQIQTVTVT